MWKLLSKLNIKFKAECVMNKDACCNQINRYYIEMGVFPGNHIYDTMDNFVSDNVQCKFEIGQINKSDVVLAWRKFGKRNKQ